MTNDAEEIRERCETETNTKVRRESGVAKIYGVDEGDEAEGAGGREESDEWEEFGNREVVRKHDPRQPSQQEKEEHEMTHLPFRRWCRRCIMGRGREEDCRKSMEEEWQVPEVHLDYIFMETREGREDISILACKRKGDESCAQYGGSEEDDGRMVLPKTDGVASRDWTGVCGHHREVRQRTCVGKFDCVMEHNEGNAERIKDDHREQSCWQFEEQRNCREGNPVGAGDDQDGSQRHRRTVKSED